MKRIKNFLKNLFVKPNRKQIHTSFVYKYKTIDVRKFQEDFIKKILQLGIIDKETYDSFKDLFKKDKPHKVYNMDKKGKKTEFKKGTETHYFLSFVIDEDKIKLLNKTLKEIINKKPYKNNISYSIEIEDIIKLVPKSLNTLDT